MATTTRNYQEPGSPDITDIGHDVFPTDTKMAGYGTWPTLSPLMAGARMVHADTPLT